jgi:PAS domain S-box-containing protein
LLDKKFNVVSFNNAALNGYRKQLNFTLQEGKNLFESQPCDRKCVAKKRHEKVLRGETVSYEINFGTPHSLSWYQVNMLPVFDKLNNVIGLIIASEDITERKKTEREKDRITTDLAQRNKDLEQFAYIISHNLRAPVANILGLGNLIQDRSSWSEEDLDKLISGLGESTGKLDAVITDLNLILQTRQNITEHKEVVRFEELVNDIKTSISTLIISENVTITTDFTQAEQILSFKTYMYSIFYNLISNSIKYKRAEEPAMIHIQSKLSDGALTVLLKDNGMGVDLKRNGEKMFGLYKRFHYHKDGKGIGLYMVKTQVETLGGRIRVQSEVNKGTEFQIEFKLENA